MSEPEQEPEVCKPRFGIGTVVRDATSNRGRIVGYEDDNYVVIFQKEGVRRVPFSYAGMTVETGGEDPEMSRVRQAVSEALQDYGWIEAELELGKRWVGGTMVLEPGDESTEPKEVPLEAFFKKVVGVREKLRVLEQKINNHPSLSPEEKLELQGNITRCYGSLTTFNALFAHKECQFRGQAQGN